ncbi:polymerase alpha-associated DNA helicase A [Seminavis robusta]|uniref:Polymerase alpha-associated DNA helicase A n=1 Tax=Seminavis robusta TaxID=568900 RepID=A0A9N8DFN4_9STRA|nr:polymerase alpha-associated DNA helicase A [Seminavis robusta]|eukprot:Sro46_g027360.1 polymerase alpha-associated DNA helicase A (3380) ;mRNA; f:33077-45465
MKDPSGSSLKNGSNSKSELDNDVEEDVRLAMKMQIEEGLETAVPRVASLVIPTTSSNTSSTSISSDNDNDAALAWNLQLKENEKAVSNDNDNDNDTATASSNLVVSNLRMGAAPYETTTRAILQQQKPKVRDLVGNLRSGAKRQNSVLMNLPPALQNQTFMEPTGFTTGTGTTTMSSSSLQLSAYYADGTTDMTTTAFLTDGSTVSSEPMTMTMTMTDQPQHQLFHHRHTTMVPIWFDVSRPGDGDDVFLHLLGDYCDYQSNKSNKKTTLLLKGVPPDQIPFLCNDPTKLGAVVATASIVTDEDEDNGKPIDTDTETSNDSIETVIQQCIHLKTSIRQAAMHLPFCVRFQLERCLLMDTAGNNDPHIYITQRYAPKNNKSPEVLQNRQNDFRFPARKMLIAFLQKVLPALLLQWSTTTELQQSSLTLMELFAEEIYEPMRHVKKQIQKKGHASSISSFHKAVEGAMDRARSTLSGAVKLCRCTEADLDRCHDKKNDTEGYTRFMRQRSLWPMAEYRVYFTPDGRLLPKGYEVVNTRNAKLALHDNKHNNKWTMEYAMRHAKAETRRALRDTGWAVRDRFAAFSDVPFTDVFRDHLQEWCQQRPMVCGRRYEFLFDKGTASPRIWFFSPSKQVSRNDFLCQLGDFSMVDKTKLGDRLSLAFTQTKPLIQLQPEQIVAIDEIVHNGYRFSDGCGVMGWDIARRVADIEPGDIMGHGSIQIRLGGFKGMLTVKKDFPPNKIGLRPSMAKFASTNRMLEVKRVSTCREGKSPFSQAVLILRDLGVPSDVFLDLQRMAWFDIAATYDPSAFQIVNSNNNSKKKQNKKPVDYQAVSSYLQRVAKQGLKHNQERFTALELDCIAKRMEEGKRAVNIRCSVTLMMGVVDEHDYLGPGEILVGNGRVTGTVLIYRPPCNAPGDVQKVTAREGRNDAVGRALRGSIVFSAKGDRPIADMLAGGDYDGDEYFIVNDPELVEPFVPVQPCDFGSQKSSFDKTIDIQKYFEVSPLTVPPNLDNQLDVLHKFFRLGNIVVASADAWTRVADRFGLQDSRAMRLSSACQQALDVRKLAFCDYDFEEIDLVLSDSHPERISKPKWNGGPDENPSNSINGELFTKWENKILDIKKTAEILRKREEDGLSDAASIISGYTENTRQFDSTAGNPSLSSTIGTEMLIDATFGRTTGFTSEPINYEQITEEGRKQLINMVLLEYCASLKKDGRATAAHSRNNAYNKPRSYDVHLVKVKGSNEEDSFRSTEELAVCMPVHSSKTNRELEWRLHNRKVAIDEVHSRCRVGSLSSFSRILDSLLSNPVPPLMRQALKREGLCKAVLPEVVENLSFAQELNSSQKQAVATIRSSSFRKGPSFFCCQGPPGTGKTTTIISMCCAAHKEHQATLVVAPSNAAVANVARKLVETTGIFGSRNVVVWGDNCDESVSFLNPKRRYKEYLKYVRADNSEKKKLILQDIAAWLKLDDVGAFTSATLEELCGDADGKRNVSSANVVLCTLNTAGSRSLRSAITASHASFHMAILDEASQSCEAEFYVLTTVPGIKHIVLVGDPRQLGPTVLSSECEDRGYGVSFLSRILMYHPEKVHLLNTQYRMEPSPLLDFVNGTFYGNKLKSDVSVMNREPPIKNQFLFVSTSKDGYGTEERQRFSWYNEYETGVIKTLLHTDPDIKSILEDPRGARVLVITPYKAQAERLSRVLRKVKAVKSFDVSTVDSFQGQEGDVVLISTVRTDSVGFTDNENRLCVALTRARRILRVVGDSEFMKTKTSHESILRKLALFSEERGLIQDASVDSAAWRRPKWKAEDTSWLATMVPRFHGCLKQMDPRDCNVAFNTLLAVATPQLNLLRSRPNDSDSGQWQTSALSKYGGNDPICVTYIAKPFISSDDGRDYVGIIEAHFAGRRHECNRFVQTNRVHNGAAIKGDLSGIKGPTTQQIAPVHSAEIDLRSWIVTSDVQGAIIDGNLDALPDGLINLDDQQKRVLSLQPPLLLESRSGTGKTNVLFAHAISYLRDSLSDYEESTSVPSILFVTVSPTLGKELRERYESVCRISQLPMPPIAFFSFRDLLQHLFRRYHVYDVIVSSACSFRHFYYSRTSHQELALELSLIENEIGGVILGALQAACKRRHLNKEEYLEEKRSNIQNKTDAGMKRRELVYEYFCEYKNWKESNKRYDLGDLVLKLLEISDENRNLDEFFVSVYLDEVQDFSYAAVYMICSIAGKVHGQWVAAGDTNQMISAGCSFKFQGLKQTLLEVKPDVNLSKTEQLRRNWRMTKSVLEVGNAILNTIKINFPEHIEYAQPEVPMKDLGLKVTLVSWRDALEIKARMGVNQAIVYAASGSADSEETLRKEMLGWSHEHPFVLSCLDAKGLEYDDVIVAFDKDRKSWDVEFEKGKKAGRDSNGNADALRNLRELYVAITRARKRVVVLVKNGRLHREFFKKLPCESELKESDAKEALLDFDGETDVEDWFVAGETYYKNENYGLAESCFIRASNTGWSNRAQGMRLQFKEGRLAEAKIAFRRSSLAFFEQNSFESCLDVLKQMAELDKLPWEEQDNKTLDFALKECPNHLSRRWTVKFAITRKAFDVITSEDMTDSELQSKFVEKRNEKWLKDKIRGMNEDERSAVATALPLIVGDYMSDQKLFVDAVDLFLLGKDETAAVRATESAITLGKFEEVDIGRVVSSWNEYGETSKQNSSRMLKTLRFLFRNPTEASKTKAKDILRQFGKRTVQLAVMESCKHTNIPAVFYRFDKEKFEPEIESALVELYGENPIEMVTFFCEHNDRVKANFAVMDYLKEFSDDVLLHKIFGSLAFRDVDIVEEIERRSMLLEAVKVCLDPEFKDIAKAAELATNLLSDESTISPETAEVLFQAFAPWLMTDQQIVKGIKQAGQTKENLYLLLGLFQNPEEMSMKEARGDCMTKLGKDVVRHAVTRQARNGGAYSILSKFDRKAFEDLKPQRKQQKSPQKPKAQTSSNLIPGDRVRVKGLVNSAFLNGKQGTVTSPLSNTGRHGVRVDGYKEPKSIRLANLEKIEKSEDEKKPPADNLKPPPVVSSQTNDSDSEPDNRKPRSHPSKKKDANDSDDDDDSDSDRLPGLVKRPTQDSSDEERRRQGQNAQGGVSRDEGAPRRRRAHHDDSSADESDGAPRSFDRESDSDSGGGSESSDDDDDEGDCPPLMAREESSGASSNNSSGFGGASDTEDFGSESDGNGPVPPGLVGRPHRHYGDSSDDSSSDGTPPPLFQRDQLDHSSSSDSPVPPGLVGRPHRHSDDSSSDGTPPPLFQRDQLDHSSSSDGSEEHQSDHSSSSSDSPPPLRNQPVARSSMDASSDEDSDEDFETFRWGGAQQPRRAAPPPVPQQQQQPPAAAEGGRQQGRNSERRKKANRKKGGRRK